MARDYVLNELDRLRKDLSRAANVLSVTRWGQLWEQVELLDYSIQASLKEGREPDWGVFMKRLCRYCDVPEHSAGFPKARRR